jgi:hypothetical protein
MGVRMTSGAYPRVSFFDFVGITIKATTTKRTTTTLAITPRRGFWRSACGAGSGDGPCVLFPIVPDGIAAPQLRQKAASSGSLFPHAKQNIRKIIALKTP